VNCRPPSGVTPDERIREVAGSLLVVQIQLLVQAQSARIVRLGEPMPIDIPKCSSPEGYEQYARNVEAQKVADWEEKAREAHRAAVRMRAAQRGAKTEAERECLQATFAYEWALFKKHKRRQPASYTWRAVRGSRHHRRRGEDGHEEEGDRGLSRAGGGGHVGYGFRGGRAEA
jgi:hypothetical protein